MTDRKKPSLFDGIRPPFLEDGTPPPFYQNHITKAQRQRLDRAFIGKRSQAYYLKQFASIDQAGRLTPSWHWAAFVSTFGWLLYRKRYLDCLVYCVAGLSFVKLNIVVVLAILEFVLIGALPDEIRWQVRVGVGLGVWLFWAAMVARWANAYYYRMARREIADALYLYPNDSDAQHAYLAQHGGVSLVGLSVAFGLFGIIVLVIAMQFMPLYVKQKEQALIEASYHALISTKRHIKADQCPPVSASSKAPYQLQTTTTVDNLPSQCAIVLTIDKAGYPLWHLNGHRLVLYRTDDHRWHCQSSLGRAWLPTHCHD